MKYCKEHPDFEAKRRPRVECAPCWRLYLENKGSSVEAYASAIEKQDKDVAKWLRANIDDIIYASLADSEEKKVETVASKLEFIPPPTFMDSPTKKPELGTVGPAKGKII